MAFIIDCLSGSQPFGWQQPFVLIGQSRVYVPASIAAIPAICCRGEFAFTLIAGFICGLPAPHDCCGSDNTDVSCPGALLTSCSHCHNSVVCKQLHCCADTVLAHTPGLCVWIASTQQLSCNSAAGCWQSKHRVLAYGSTPLLVARLPLQRQRAACAAQSQVAFEVQYTQTVDVKQLHCCADGLT